MGRLLLVRHGQSLWNRDGIVQGQDGPGLSELGRAQAEVLAEQLALEVPDAALVTSDLDRCRETIAPLEARLERRASVDERLRERHFGRWQGRTHDEIGGLDPQLYARWRDRQDVHGELGGESTPQLLERVVPVLRRLAAAAAVTVVSTHGGPIWHGVHDLLGVPEMTLGPVANASVTELELAEDGSARLYGWNSVTHIPPQERTTWVRPAA